MTRKHFALLPAAVLRVTLLRKILQMATLLSTRISSASVGRRVCLFTRANRGEGRTCLRWTSKDTRVIGSHLIDARHNCIVPNRAHGVAAFAIDSNRAHGGGSTTLGFSVCEGGEHSSRCGGVKSLVKRLPINGRATVQHSLWRGELGRLASGGAWTKDKRGQIP
jgi:hypothetical protein